MSTLRFSVRRLLLAAIAGPLAFSTAARGQATVTWSGGDSTWSQPDTNSFNATYASGDTAVFAGAGQGTVTIGSGVTPGQVNVTSGSYTFSGGLGGSTATSGLAKSGTGTLTLSGDAAANTYQGTTTVSGGTLVVSKANNVIAVPGNLVIENAVIRFGTTGGNPNLSNQIASTAAVTMSGSTAGFNGIGFADVNQSNFSISQTLASFTVTGGVVNTTNSASATGLTITGAGSITGGAGNTEVWYGSGGLGSFGSLSLVGMTGTALNPNAAAPNTFRLFGNNATRQTQVTIGSGGLSLDGSNILLGLGAEAGRLGSRIVLNGNVTTSGSSASSIMPPTSGDSGSFGTRQVALSSTAGSVTRTFTTGGGGADLTVSVAITNGSATTAGLTKAGAGTLTLSAANTYNGTTTISAGTLALAAVGSFASSPTITVGNAGSSGAVLDLTAKTGTFAFTSSQTVGGIGTIRMDAGDTARFAGILAPGNSAGILTFDGGTGLLSGTTQIEIFGASRGTGYDAIDLINAATLDYGNGVLALDFGSWLASPQSYQLFGSGSSSLLGDFSSVTIAGTNYAGLTFSGSNGVWTSQGTSPANQTLTFTESTGTLVIVPEPAAVALAGVGIAAAACALRRHRKSPPCPPSLTAAA